MRRLVVLPLVAVLAVPATADAATRTVRLRSATFAPAAITIAKGDRIRFRWVTGFHDVVRVSGPRFAPIAARSSGTVTRRFARAGRYRLVCTVHRDIGMYLTVRVRR